MILYDIWELDIVQKIDFQSVEFFRNIRDEQAKMLVGKSHKVIIDYFMAFRKPLQPITRLTLKLLDSVEERPLSDPEIGGSVKSIFTKLFLSDPDLDDAGGSGHGNFDGRKFLYTVSQEQICYTS
jgi:hypothetical protein